MDPGAAESVMIQVFIDRLSWKKMDPIKDADFFVRCGTCSPNDAFCLTSTNQGQVKWTHVHTGYAAEHPSFRYGPVQLLLERDHSLVFEFFAEVNGSGIQRPASTQSPLNPTHLCKDSKH